MKNLFNEETFNREGAILDADEALLLYRLVSKLSRDDLTDRGFTHIEAERIEQWSEDFVK